MLTNEQLDRLIKAIHYLVQAQLDICVEKGETTEAVESLKVGFNLLHLLHAVGDVKEVIVYLSSLEKEDKLDPQMEIILTACELYEAVNTEEPNTTNTVF